MSSIGNRYMMTAVNNDFERKVLSILSVILWGIAAHGISLTNKFSWHDDLASFWSVGLTTVAGRFSLKIYLFLEQMVWGRNYSLPFYNGVITLGLIGCNTYLIVKILDLKKRLSIILISALLVTCPTICSLFGYMFMAITYMLSVTFVMVGLYLGIVKNTTKELIIGAIFFAVGMGFYQGALAFGVGFALLVVLKSALEDERMSTAIRLIFEIPGALVVYLVLNKFFQAIDKIEKPYYNVNDSILNFVHSGAKRVFDAYKYFIKPINANDSLYIGGVKYIYCIFELLWLVITAIIVAYIYRKDKKRAVLVGVLSSLIPIGTNFVYCMVDSGIHSLMVYSRMLFLIWVLFLCEWAENTGMLRESIKALVIMINTCLIIIAIAFCKTDNIAYLKANLVQEETTAYFNQLISRIKSTDGYKDEYPVVYLNEMHIQDETITHMPELDDITFIPYWSTSWLVNNYQWRQYMKVWCGFEPKEASASELSSEKQVSQMPHYPDAGSIMVIDQYIVVNF